jgi:hypothetical protein
MKSISDPELCHYVGSVLIRALASNPDGCGMDFPKGKRFFQLLSECAKKKTFGRDQLSLLISKMEFWPGVDCNGRELFSTLIRDCKMPSSDYAHLASQRVSALAVCAGVPNPWESHYL